MSFFFENFEDLKEKKTINNVYKVKDKNMLVELQ